eukprot:1426411-Amphidinium_carterae.1
MPAPRPDFEPHSHGMRPMGSNVDTFSQAYIKWQLEENLKIHGINAARLTKQVKQLQADLAASQQETSELRAKNMLLQQQFEQLQTTNYYCPQDIQANAENLGRITQLEKKKAMLNKTCDHYKQHMIKAQQAERAWHTHQSSTKAAAPVAASTGYCPDDELPDWAKEEPSPQTVPNTPLGGILSCTDQAKLLLPKATQPVTKARLPLPKRPLATQREDEEMPGWAQQKDPARQASAAAAATPIL